ncbi:MAG TPA: peptidylprolyl isomerase [candidate division Zixibacteria bacterium]|nr:peptidylprolyl isomerase [candidate division Zixibacteria bacterium]
MPPAHAETVVARIGSKTITRSQLEDAVAARGWTARNPETDRRRLEGLLDELILDELVTREARTLDLAQDYKVVVRLRRALIAAVSELFDADHLHPQVQIDSTDIDSFYNEYISRYTASRDQRRVRHITTTFPGRGVPESYTTFRDPVYYGWDPQRKIDSIYVRLVNGEDFGDLASIHSEEPHSKGQRGEIGWVSEYSLAEGEFADTCLSLPLYKITRPFKTELGWHIVQVLEERPKGPVPINPEIATDIAKLIAKDRVPAITRRISDSVVAECRLDVFEETLTIPDKDLDPGRPLALVNGRDTIYAAAYLIDRDTWVSKLGKADFTPDDRREIITSYFHLAAWNAMLRDLGYYDRQDVQELAANQEQHERENIVRVHLSAPDAVPDSADVRRYYETHKSEFSNPPVPLQQAWHRISAKLRDSMRAAEQARRTEELERRYGVTRYPDRLQRIALPNDDDKS